MANEWYMALGAIVLLGVWVFAELRARFLRWTPLHGRATVVAIELDEEERAELKAVLSRQILAPRMGIAGSGDRDDVDGSKRGPVAEKILRRLE